MNLAWQLGYSGSTLTIDIGAIHEAERLGYGSIWTAEAYGSDAVTVATWIAARTERIHVGTAIMQMHARTPAMTAMTAMSLDALSDGRFRLGLGVSGPQVVEGWHGVAYGKPLARTREYVQIVRAVLQRDKPVQFKGEYYEIPYAGPDASGLGKPLRSILHGRPSIPIYLAAIGPKNVALAGEIADGWLSLFFSLERRAMFEGWLKDGFDAGGRDAETRRRFDLMASVPVVVGPDVDACRAQVKSRIALYVGGMGARGKNFYNDLACRYGYEEAARAIQDFYLTGRKAEAEAAVPDALVDEVALCGPPERIRDRLSAYRDAGIPTLFVAGDQLAMRTVAEAM